ncbi:MAG TPA: FkbM family methyltransferase [Planctomycetes bacterium]|nr:FkbM family methyltransferase [Planctomycetota bacterium]
MSYSQLDEDHHITQYFAKIFGNAPGKFLDIGANNGITFSNTRRLLELGWNGVCVEPDPFAFGDLVKNNANGEKVVLINAGMNIQRGLCKFHIFNDTLLSSLNADQEQTWHTHSKRGEIYINTVTWDDIFKITGTGFNFVNIDAEGVSVKLLSTFPFEQLLPNMFCVEHDGDYGSIHKILKDKGYREYHTNSLNCLYVKNE